MAYSKIGFHSGVSAQRQGIGEYFQQLDEAGIPFSVTSVDDIGLVCEGANFAVKSGVNHTVVLRFVDLAVPDYNKPPQEAAEEQWWWLKLKLDNSPELKPYLPFVYLLATNEARTKPDTNNPNWGGMHPADWLGWFSFYLARLVLENTTAKFLAFGMSAGEPEPDDWRRPGMRTYLNYCHEQAGRAGVALHEGMISDGRFTAPDGRPLTYKVDPPLAWYPYLVGRFEVILDLCREWDIAPPPIVITEWAWNHRDMAEPVKAMTDIAELAEYLAQHPSIQGCTLWNTETGWGELPDKMQNMIPLITEFNLNARYDDPVVLPLPDDLTFEQRVWQATVDEQTRNGIRLNPDAAIMREITKRKMTPVINEIIIDGVVAQAAEDMDGRKPRLVFVWRNGRVESFTDPFVTEPTPPPDPPPPPETDKIDLLSFMRADPDAWVVVRHATGETEDFRVFLYGDDRWAMVKNSLAEFWRADDEYIYLEKDTSPSNADDGTPRLYKVEPGQWARRFMSVGESFNDGGHTVQFYRKSDCQPHPQNSGRSRNVTVIEKLEHDFTFNRYGQNMTLDEVLFIKGGAEVQVFARHQGRACGRVAWYAPWGASEIVELYFDRGRLNQPPNEYCP